MGVMWTPDSLAPAPAPVAASVPLPRPGSALGALCGFDWSRMTYEEFRSDNPLYGLKGGASVSPAVLTRPPGPGHFWYVAQLGYSDDEANARKKGLFLVPPFFSTPDKLQFFFMDTISNTFRSVPKTGIRLYGSFGFGNASGLENVSVNEHVGLFSPSALVVPPGWAILLCQDDAANAAGVSNQLTIQVAYADMLIGETAPGF